MTYWLVGEKYIVIKKKKGKHEGEEKNGKKGENSLHMVR